MSERHDGLLTEEDVRRRLQQAVIGESQKAIAARAGVSTQYVCDVVNGRRTPTGGLLGVVGVRYPGRLYEIVEPEVRS